MSTHFKLVPLSSLQLSDDNVRSQGGEDPALPALAANILAIGVLTPLTVVPALGKTGKPLKEKWAVIAGGRRYRALRSLANELKIGENHQVPVVVRGAGEAVTEISLAENVLRAALKPHEEFAAFAKMAREGVTPQAIAEHFGVTVRRVEQLLRLGNLAPPIAAAFAEGGISLAQAQAFASTSDTELQEKVFATVMQRSSWEREAYQIRHLIKGSGGDLVGQLRAVGLDVYTAAGGRFDADLFGDETLEGRVLDPDILARLFEEREQRAMATLREQLPQVELVEGVDWRVGEPIRPERGELPAEAAERRDELQAERDRIQAELDGLCDEDGNLVDEEAEEKAFEIERRRDAVDVQIEAVENEAPFVFPEVEGKIVATPRFNTQRGHWEVYDYRLVPADWTPENPVPSTVAEKASAPGDVGTGYQSPEAKVKAAFGLSGPSIEIMQAHRLQILQAMMVADGAFGIGPDFLTFAVIRNAEGGDMASQVGIVGHICTDTFGGNDPEVQAQPGAKFVGLRHSELSQDWLREDNPARAFAMFLALVDEERSLWAGYAATLILSRSMNAEGFGNKVHDAIAAELDASDEKVRRYWTPDAAFWARLPKKHRLAALAEIDEELADRSKKLGADELIERCVGVFSGDQAMIAKYIPIERSHAAAEAAKRWVPEYLRFAAPVALEAEPEVMDEPVELAEAAE